MLKRKLQVFISSTFTDLIPERQAAVAAVLKAGHIPAGMELFTAGNKSQWDTITRWIDESDVYMLILGGRYGSLEPSSSKSYTELEYEYAVKIGKPLFSVVIKEDALEAKVREHGTSMMEKESPSALKAFRAKVLTNISSFFSDEKDVRLTVHESLADFRDNPTVRGWISAAEVEDSKVLHDEISRLRTELDKLKRERELQSKAGRTGMIEGEFRRLQDILQATEIMIPKALTEDGTDDIKSDLLTMFVGNKDHFVSGISNTPGMTKTANYFFFDIGPKLMVHGLAQSEKIAGIQARRLSVSSKGLSFLAEIEGRLKLPISLPETETLELMPAGKGTKPVLNDKLAPSKRPGSFSSNYLVANGRHMSRPGLSA